MGVGLGRQFKAQVAAWPVGGLDPQEAGVEYVRQEDLVIFLDQGDELAVLGGHRRASGHWRVEGQQRATGEGYAELDAVHCAASGRDHGQPVIDVGIARQ